MPRRTIAQSKEPQPQESEMPSQKLVEQESDDDHVDENAAGPFVLQQPQKKKYRPSKRDIPDYQFTDAQISEIVEFVKQHPCLYSKRDKQWCNPRLKETLWTELAANFTNCSFQQVRKFFEKKRTDFGKIEKRESKSGAPARNRTVREEEVMTTWEFLGGHIAHVSTLPSESFSPTSQMANSDMNADSSSAMSGLSAASIIRRKNLKRRTKPTNAVASVASFKQTTTEHAIKVLLDKANILAQKKQAEGPEAEIQDFSTYLCSRLRRVSPVNFKLLFGNILEMVSALEEPPEGTSSISNPGQILDSLKGTPKINPLPLQWQQPQTGIETATAGNHPTLPMYQLQPAQSQQYQQQPFHQQPTCFIAPPQQQPLPTYHNLETVSPRQPQYMTTRMMTPTYSNLSSPAPFFTPSPSTSTSGLSAMFDMLPTMTSPGTLTSASATTDVTKTSPMLQTPKCAQKESSVQD